MEGRTLSHFRITARIGAGGMGVVYEAEDLTLRRRVALKVLPPEVTGDTDIAPRALARLRHPAEAWDPRTSGYSVRALLYVREPTPSSS
jgi:serine/threonine protein kinase